MLKRRFHRFLVLCRVGVFSVSAIRGVLAADAGAPTSAQPVGREDSAPVPRRPVNSMLEAQVELHRRGFSCGSIDGVGGAQTAAALAAFQRAAGIRDNGVLNEETKSRLTLAAPALDTYSLTATDIGSLHPVPETWLEKSELSTLGYATAVELVAERFHAHPNLIRKLNPDVNWSAILLGAKIVVPAGDHVVIDGVPNQLVISLSEHQLEVVDENSRVIAHFPVSIARMVEKRPVGQLQVTVVIPNPNYTFDPELFPESAEGKVLNRRLTIPPGPNNPVGLVWIGLNLPGYGIHGTPEPEKIGRTESHGCFRLANWDALTLAALVKVGTPVIVEP